MGLSGLRSLAGSFLVFLQYFSPCLMSVHQGQSSMAMGSPRRRWYGAWTGEIGFYPPSPSLWVVCSWSNSCVLPRPALICLSADQHTWRSWRILRVARITPSMACRSRKSSLANNSTSNLSILTTDWLYPIGPLLSQHRVTGLFTHSLLTPSIHMDLTQPNDDSPERKQLYSALSPSLWTPYFRYLLSSLSFLTFITHFRFSARSLLYCFIYCG